MNIAIKKDIFFSLLNVVFLDKNHTDINYDNCSGFYNFLIDRLQEESDKYIKIDREEKFYFFQTIIGILEDFGDLDILELNKIIHSRKHFINYLVIKTPIKVDIEVLQIVLLSLEYKYNKIKKDFLSKKN